MIRNVILLISIAALLTGCFPAPTPSPSAPAAPSEEVRGLQVTPSQAPWASLSPDDLPTQEEELSTFFAQSSPSICLLGSVEAAHVSLYGLNHGYGAGILLWDGNILTHFDQSFAELPQLWWADFDGDGQEELAVRYLIEQNDQGVCAYDLAFYRPSQSGWVCCPVSRDLCADRLLEKLDTSWDDRTHILTLTCAGQQVTIPFPEDRSPGRLVVGHMCLFYEEANRFSAVLDVWIPSLSLSAATLRTEILYDGETFQFQNICLDFNSGV